MQSGETLSKASIPPEHTGTRSYFHSLLFRPNNNRILKSVVARLALAWLALMVAIAIAAPFLANENPLFFSYRGNTFYPVISGEEETVVEDLNSNTQVLIDFSDPGENILHDAAILHAPVRYSPNKSDMNNADYVGPGDLQYSHNGERLSGLERHLLGTGRRGEDVLAGLIHGTRVSMTVGIFSMFLAGIIGIVLGALAGYFGDTGVKITRGKLIMLVTGLLPAWFYGFQLRSFALESALNTSPISLAMQLLISLCLFISVLFVFGMAGKLMGVISWFKKEIYLMVDSIISRLIEILISLPRLILIISIAAISKPSLLNLILIIGFTSWTEIARFTRAEMLRIRSLEYIQSARSLGYSELRIIFWHALPNAIAPALVTISFGIAGAILMESALSFLGIGVPPDIATWGSLLASGKENFSAWWLVLFPGLAIFFTVTSFNILGEALRDAFDPKLKK